jgi:hypothetical protein
VERSFITPLDGLRRAVDEAERALQQARQRHEVETAALWAQYQTGYEQHLRPGAEEPDAEDRNETLDASDESQPGDVRARAEEPLAEDADSADETEPERAAEVSS